MKMHHFEIEACADTGAWLRDLNGAPRAKYLGEIDTQAFYSKKDTYDLHFDQHDGEALSRDVWSIADGVEPTSDNVALTVRHVQS